MGLIPRVARAAALAAVACLAWLTWPATSASAEDVAATPSVAAPEASTPVPAGRLAPERRRSRRPAELPRRSKVNLGDELPDDNDLPWREALLVAVVSYLIYRRFRR